MSDTDHRSTGLDVTGRSLPIALLRAREKVMARFRPMLKQHGMTEQQWRVIRVLDEAPGIDMSALTEMANILAPSLSRMIKGLEDRGLVKIGQDKEDGRRVSLTLTPAGKALIRQIAPESAAIRAELEAQVGAAQISALLDALDALQRALDESSSDLPD